MTLIKKLTAAAFALGSLATLALSTATPASAWGYADSYWYQQQVYANAYGAYSDYQLGQYEYADAYGNSYWGGDNSGGSNWVDNYGSMYQMDSYSPPDYSGSYYEVTPVDSGYDYSSYE